MAAKERPPMMYDVQGYADKHGIIRVPDPMFIVRAEPPGIVLEYSHLYKDVKQFFDKLKCQASLYKVTNNKRKLLETKKSLPMISDRVRMSYGKQPKKGKRNA